MVDRGKLVEVLRRVAERYPQVKLMYLFGSYAERRAAPASDIDIAVVTAKPSVIPHVAAELAEELQIPEEKISILDLEYASPALVASILKRGVKIVDRDEGSKLKQLSENAYPQPSRGCPKPQSGYSSMLARIMAAAQASRRGVGA